MNFGQMIYNLIRKKLGKIGINSSARNYKIRSSPNASIPDTGIRGRIWFFRQFKPDSRSESLRE